jgi:hypothetical protein
MHYEREVFMTQFPIAKRFVCHLAYYKMLNAAYKVSPELQPEFWIPTIDAHILQAAISWCNVFGAEGSSDLHWKHLSKVDSNRLQASFREGLPRWIGLGWPEWETYWKDMTGFRNKYVAHREKREYKKAVPKFDIALKVTYYYDNWVRNVISPDIFDEPPLKVTYERLTTEYPPLIQLLFETTKAFSRSAGASAGR